jgi:hypothetical protein
MNRAQKQNSSALDRTILLLKAAVIGVRGLFRGRVCLGGAGQLDRQQRAVLYGPRPQAKGQEMVTIATSKKSYRIANLT